MTPINLEGRRCAASLDFRINEPIWYRHTQRAGYGFTKLVPGFFGRYGAARCQVIVVLRSGAHRPRWVLPANVFERPEIAEGKEARA